MGHIVKRKGHSEEFEPRKIYASVFSACMVLRMSDSEAELLADAVSKEVAERASTSEELSAKNLHSWVVQSLEKLNKDVAFMYDTHRDIS